MPPDDHDENFQSSDNVVALPSNDDLEVIERLAALDSLQYDRERKDAAEKLGVRGQTLDKKVKEARTGSGARQGRELKLHEPEPWDEPVDGDALLDELRAALERYIVLPPYTSTAVALWIIHTHAVETAYHTPRLLFKSPEMRCGKTTALNVLRRLVWRPLLAANISAAAVFRTVEAMQPTLLVDEADTFLTRHDELRGIINSGHEKHGTVVKVDGDDNEPRIFATFAATAIAAIGNMPGTIEDRSITIRMKRKKASESVERLRGDRAPQLDDLARQARRWAADNLVALTAADAEPPSALSDRAADSWRPLICIADLAGGDWPDLARQAAVALVAVDDEESIRIMLLKDIRAIFDARGEDAVTSESMVADLHDMEDRPWIEYGKSRKPITKGRLANLLRPFGIGPKNLRTGANVRKGYHLEQFKDAFDRYIGVTPGSSPEQNATRYKPQKTAANGRFQNATQKPDVAVSNPPKPAASLGCSGVAAQTPPRGDARAYQPDDGAEVQLELEDAIAAVQTEPEASAALMEPKSNSRAPENVPN